MNISNLELISILLSAVVFQGLSRIIVRYNVIPKAVDNEKTLVWFNVFLSFIHSSYASFACLLCFYMEPRLAYPSQMDNPGSLKVRIFAYITLGYFFHDLVHTLRSFSWRKSWGVIFHHVWMIWGYYIFSLDMNKQNIIIVGLAAEINTVFLHLRQLLKLAKISLSTRIYQVNKWINVMTFFIFRFPAFGWMFLYFFCFTDYTKTYNAALAAIGCFEMNIFNLIVFGRIIYTDFIVQKSKKTE